MVPSKEPLLKRKGNEETRGQQRVGGEAASFDHTTKHESLQAMFQCFRFTGRGRSVNHLLYDHHNNP